MSIYVMSDIHGQYDTFLKMLDYIKFSKNDQLIIAGDIIDRGNQNLKMIEWAMKNSNKNVTMLCGNHEDMLFNYIKGRIELRGAGAWFSNGGFATYREICTLPQTKIDEILNWIEGLPKIIDISVGNKDYVIAHAYVNRENDDECLWKRVLFEDESGSEKGKISIVGHTPTFTFTLIGCNVPVDSIGILKSPNKKVYYIDCGAGYPNKKISRLACLRLDDEKEFYLEVN